MSIGRGRGRRLARCLALAVLPAAAACGDDPTEPETGPACSATTPLTAIAVGQTLTGALGATDCLLGNGSSADLYGLTVATARSVQIDMTSTTVDAYLLVVDPAGNVLDQDDDDGGGTDARVTLSLPAGTFTVVATSFEPRETGGYTLRVQ
jgi:serine protease Do